MSDDLHSAGPQMPPQPGGGPATGDADPAGGVSVVTMGCRLNAYESAVIEAHARAAGRDNLVVVNTCAVTGEAVRQARQAVRKARKANPTAEVVVTGCAAQIDPDMFAAMPEADAVIGNEEKLHAATWATAGGPRVQVNDIMSVRETASHLVEGFEGRARAFVQVQQGCDHRCTFCIIPYGRGNARSVPAGEAARQAAALCDAGYQEIVLTGVDLTSWGQDLPGTPKLGRLVRAILEAAPGLSRVRLSSVDAVEIDPELLAFITEEPRVAPHLHLSLQAGDDMILKRMKRRHARADAVALCAAIKARRPEIALGADLIAGFPTETEAMFENTLALVEDCGLAYLHVFPFSPRPGTPAARMPQVDKPVIKDRAARLRAAGATALARHLDGHVGREAEVLVERGGLGRLADYAEARLDTGPARPGALVRARFTGHDGRALTGEVLAASGATPAQQGAPV